MTGNEKNKKKTKETILPMKYYSRNLRHFSCAHEILFIIKMASNSAQLIAQCDLDTFFIRRDTQKKVKYFDNTIIKRQAAAVNHVT